MLRVCGTVQQNPHMRAFWASTISFFLAFLGWFALAPLGLEVATSMGQCENQLYPPASNPTRPAYLKYKNLKSGLTYCQYGTVKNSDGKLTDCQPVPADKLTGTAEERMQYRPEVLAKCVCTTGTDCNGIIANAGGGSSGIHHLCSHCTWHIAGAIWSCERAIRPADLWSFLGGHGGSHFSPMELHLDPILHWLCRSYLCDQSVLVFAHVFAQCGRHCQCHCSRLGQRVTQIFMISVLFNPMVNSGMAADMAWRVSMIVPAVLFLICAVTMKLLCWDTPNAKRFDEAVTGKTQKPSLWDYVEVLKDVRVLVMIFQYSACFGTELAMNNQLATHFRTLLPNGCSRRFIIGRSFWIDEPLCPLAWRQSSCSASVPWTTPSHGTLLWLY